MQNRQTANYSNNNQSFVGQQQPWQRYLKVFLLFSLLTMGAGLMDLLWRGMRETEDGVSSVETGDINNNIVLGSDEFQVNTYTTYDLT